MLAKTPIDQRFYNWVARQDPSAQYYWNNCVECACGRFLQEELGFSNREVQQEYITLCFGQNPDPMHAEVWTKFNAIASAGGTVGWTFGELRKCLAKEMPECVA